MSRFDDYPKRLVTRINNGKIVEQKYSSFIRELNSFSDERLDSEALVCGAKKLTYRQMFDEWDKFARVYSALGITGENGSRIGLMTSFSTDCVNMFYGASITGASISMIQVMDMLDHDRYKNAIGKEGITDLILASDAVKPDLLKFVMDTKDSLSIRNVIIYYPHKDKSSANSDMNYNSLRRINGVLFLESIEKKYKDAEIIATPNKSCEAAVIFHTSGTTSGIHKPVPLSDSAFNESAARLMRDKRFTELNSYRCLMTLEPFGAYSACDMLHLPLAFGGTVILPSGGIQDPSTLKLITDQKISILFTGGVAADIMMKVPVRPDLSNLELIFLGGGFVSAEKKKKMKEFLRECSSDAGIYVGYGLTEAGGAVILTERDTDTDDIGRALPGVKIKLYDDEKDIYLDVDGSAGTGALCISTKSLSSGVLNDFNIFELEEIDGEKYLNTYDLVDVDDSGSIRIIGRMNKYFVNNDGVRFDAGLVETAVASQPGIEACGLVPYYNKMVHDTLPVLYVIPDAKGPRGVKTVKDALVNAFVIDGKFAETNLPSRVQITDKLPLTETGKVDVYAILKDVKSFAGETFEVKPIKRGKKLIDVKLIHLEKLHLIIGGGIPDELEHDVEMIKKAGGIAGRFSADPGAENSGAGPENMIKNMIESGMIKPEMIGAMLARMLKDSCKERRSKRRNHDSYYRGFNGPCFMNDVDPEDEDE